MSRIASLALVLVAVLAASAAPASASRAIGTPGLSFTANSILVFGPNPGTASDSACYLRTAVTLAREIAKRAGEPVVTLSPDHNATGCLWQSPASATAGGVLDAMAFGYSSFAGTLPDITRVSGATAASVRIWAAGGMYATLPSRCEYTTVGSTFVNLSGDPATTRQISFRGAARLSGGPATCPSVVALNGVLAGLPLAIPLTLI